MASTPLTRKTKIISTLGPATDSEEVLGALITQGVNVLRLNMSHAPHDWVREVVPRIRRVSEGLRKRVAILMDTQGPSIRTGQLDSKLTLTPGDKFVLTVRGQKSEEEFSADVDYDGLVEDIGIGDTVLIDNGVIQMKVLSKQENQLTCEVLTKGVFGSRRRINLPGVKVNLPPMTDKDREDITLGAEVGVDWVALSFVREPSDMKMLRAFLVSLECNARTVAKIEDQSAVDNIRGIVKESDAIMVARGDLGIEVPYEELPIIQRKIVKTCIKFVKPVIVATHMLESMIENPLPTRAEITDVANAVFEQADAIMLSGETAVGKYPVKCVEVLDRVAQRIERSGNAGYDQDVNTTTDREQLVASAVHLADDSRAKGIMVFTRSGRLAALTAGLRPRFSTIFAFTPKQEVAEQLCLYYGVNAILLDFSEKVNVNILEAEDKLKARGLVQKGERLVVVSDLIVGDQMIQSSYLRVVR